MNNIICSLDKTLNEIIYDFSSTQSWDLLENFKTSNNSAQIRKKIANSLIWTQLQMKHQYDRKHQSLNVKVEDHVFLRLHKEYNISFTKIIERKFFQQYTESFRVLEKIENLAYRLDFSRHWKIHSMIFVIQIEQVSDSTKNSFLRSRSEKFELVHMKEDIDNVKSYEIERLINKKIIIYETKHLMRWKEWESSYDEWRSIFELQNALKLINDYEKFMNNTVFILDRLSRHKFIMKSFMSTLSHEFIKNNKIVEKSIINSATNASNDQTFAIRRFT
jgi:hypothetical protein